MKTLVAFFCGLLMAAGLGISGMTQPSKVLGFLDFFGDFDPSLMFVMGGAIGVHVLAYRVVAKRRTPFLAKRFQLPAFKSINGRLIGGALIFGVGWGLSGLCPGPALTSLATGATNIVIFVIALIAGQVLYFALERSLKSPKPSASPGTASRGP